MSGRGGRGSARLVALVRAGRYRFALPAGAIRDVQQNRPEAPARALCERFGETVAAPPPWAVTLGEDRLRCAVDLVEGVRDLGGAPVYQLPAGVAEGPGELVRGALSVEDGLALELRPESLPGLAPRTTEPSPAPKLAHLDAPAAKALVFTVAGRSMAFALPHVLSVVGKPRVAAVPRAPAGVFGVVEHGHALFGVTDLGAVHFGRPGTGELGVLVEQEGRPWMVLADAVLGIRNRFRATPEAEPGWLEGERGERAFFVRLFPPLGGADDRT